MHTASLDLLSPWYLDRMSAAAAAAAAAASLSSIILDGVENMTKATIYHNLTFVLNLWNILQETTKNVQTIW